MDLCQEDLRCLRGYGLSLWRLGRFAEAGRDLLDRADGNQPLQNSRRDPQWPHITRAEEGAQPGGLEPCLSYRRNIHGRNGSRCRHILSSADVHPISLYCYSNVRSTD